MSCSLLRCEDIQSLPRLWTVRQALRFRGLWERNFTHHVVQPAGKPFIWGIIVKSHSRVARIRRQVSDGESRASGTCKETQERG